MKKFILLIAILCIGCDMSNDTQKLRNSSEEVNKYKEVIEETVNSTRKELGEPIENKEYLSENNDSLIEPTGTWYAENKDELKEISKDVIESDKENIQNIIETTKTWYGENKDELKEISKDVIESDKENIQNIIETTKTWYGENKDELKEISKDIIKNDKDTVNDLYNKIKNIE